MQYSNEAFTRDCKPLCILHGGRLSLRVVDVWTAPGRIDPHGNSGVVDAA